MKAAVNGMINLHIRGWAGVHMMVQVAFAPSQMSYIAGHIPQGQGKCYVDGGDAVLCVYSTCARMYDGGICLCVQRGMHYHGIMKNRGAPCML